MSFNDSQFRSGGHFFRRFGFALIAFVFFCFLVGFVFFNFVEAKSEPVISVHDTDHAVACHADHQLVSAMHAHAVRLHERGIMVHDHVDGMLATASNHLVMPDVHTAHIADSLHDIHSLMA